MTTRDIGATLRDLYGRAYAPSSVSRMLEATAADVEAWLARALPPRVPVLYIDCLHARVPRGGAVAPEAFYVALGVLPDGRRGVLGIGNRPTEGAGGWAQMLEGPRARGLDAVGVVVADGLKGLADAVAATLPGCALQRCTVHLRRNCLDEVRKADRARMREDLDRLLRAGDPGYTPAQGWRDWGGLPGPLGAGLPPLQPAAGGRVLPRLLHLPPLRPRGAANPVLHQLDRAAQPPLPPRAAPPRPHAQRGGRRAPAGPRGHGVHRVLPAPGQGADGRYRKNFPPMGLHRKKLLTLLCEFANPEHSRDTQKGKVSNSPHKHDLELAILIIKKPAQFSEKSHKREGA